MILFAVVENDLADNKLVELLPQLRTSDLSFLAFLGFFIKDFNTCKRRL